VGRRLRERFQKRRNGQPPTVVAGVAITGYPVAAIARGRRLACQADLDEAVGNRVLADRRPHHGLPVVAMVLDKVVPPRVGRRRNGMIKIGHGHVQIQDALLHPRQPILQHAAVGARARKIRRVGYARRAREHRGRKHHLGFAGDGGKIHLAHQGGDLVAAERRPVRVAGGGPARAVESRIEPRQGGLTVTPQDPGITDIVPVQPVHVVARDNIHGHLENMLLHLWVRGIEVMVLPIGAERARAGPVPPVRMEIQRMVGLGRRAAPQPSRVGHDPAMNLQPGTVVRVVRLGNQIRQGIEVLRHPNRFGLKIRVVERVRPPPDLHHQRIEMARPRIAYQLRNLRGVIQPRTPAIHPEPAEFPRPSRHRQPNGHDPRHPCAQALPPANANTMKTGTAHSWIIAGETENTIRNRRGNSLPPPAQAGKRAPPAAKPEPGQERHCQPPGLMYSQNTWPSRTALLKSKSATAPW